MECPLPNRCFGSGPASQSSAAAAVVRVCQQRPATNPTTGPHEFLTVSEAARLLRVSEVTVRRLARRGELPVADAGLAGRRGIELTMSAWGGRGGPGGCAFRANLEK
ncbi:MAG: helix-turn-helix domain-containing protein [Thermoleophilaceae bacterium]